MKIPRHLDSDFLRAFSGIAFNDDGDVVSNDHVTYLSVAASAPAPVRAALLSGFRWVAWGRTMIVPVLGRAEPGTLAPGVEVMATAPAPSSALRYEKGPLSPIELVAALAQREARRAEFAQ